MTKKDIVMKVSNETNLTQIDVKKIVQKTLDVISCGAKVIFQDFKEAVWQKKAK
ncbi:MAG: HU family DNA-binding protein [Candidatus Omnitrophica bacterium]|nr:HU family DNA-binding protein [Candidatus Omnitrophota bacterium]